MPKTVYGAITQSDGIEWGCNECAMNPSMYYNMKNRNMKEII